MTNPAPIVESIKGKREFLLTAPGRPPYVESRSEPFPAAGDIETALRARRGMDAWQEQYGTGRTANNLAAVQICCGDLEAALVAAREAESTFVDMLQSSNPHPLPLTFGGLAMVKYNAAVLFFAAGDHENNFVYADDNRLGAFEALMEVGGDAGEDVELIRSALMAFPALR